MKLNDVNSYIISNTDIKEMIIYFKDRNHKSKMKYEISKTPTSMLESVDSVARTSSTTTSVILSVTRVGLIGVPLSAGIICPQSLGTKFFQKIVLIK